MSETSSERPPHLGHAIVLSTPGLLLSDPGSYSRTSEMQTLSKHWDSTKQAALSLRKEEKHLIL